MKNSAFSIVIFTFLLSAIGIYSFLRLPQFGLIEDDQVTINCNWSNAYPEQIEQSISSKIEAVISTLPGVERVNTVSSSGSSTIVVTFEKGSNNAELRIELATLLRQIYRSLPPGASFPVAHYASKDVDLTTESECYALYSTHEDQDPFLFYKNTLERLLSDNESVKSASVDASPEWGTYIYYNQKRLADLHLLPSEISEAVRTYLQCYQLGQSYINSDVQDHHFAYLMLKQREFPRSQWEEIPIQNSNGHLITLGDLASINIGYGPRSSYFHVNGYPAIKVFIRPAYSSIYDNGKESLHKAIISLSKKLPSGYILVPYNDNGNDPVADQYPLLLYILSLLCIGVLIGYVSRTSLIGIVAMLLSYIATISISCILMLVMDKALGPTVLMATIIASVFSLSMIILKIRRIVSGKPTDRLLILAPHIIGISLPFPAFFLGRTLFDFFSVVSVILFVNLIVIQFFLPAISEVLSVSSSVGCSRKPWLDKVKKVYAYGFERAYSCRKLLMVVIILMWGVPIFLLPVKIPTVSNLSRLYNDHISTPYFNYNIRPFLERVLGGAISKFINRPNISYVQARDKTEIDMDITIPANVQIGVLENVATEFEAYLKSFDQLSSFTCDIQQSGDAEFRIYFKPTYEAGGFPFYLKSKLEEKATLIDLATFSITGMGYGFSNIPQQTALRYQLAISGYNYRQLYAIGDTIQKFISRYSRARDVLVTNGQSFMQHSSREFKFVFDPWLLAVEKIDYSNIDGFGWIRGAAPAAISSTADSGRLVPVFLAEKRDAPVNLWHLTEDPWKRDSSNFLRLTDIGYIDTTFLPPSIYRENQEYKLVIRYSFVGEENLGDATFEDIKSFASAELPFGFKLLDEDRGKQYRESSNTIMAIALSLLLSFITSCIITNDVSMSLLVPVGILISFVGIFMLFSTFGLYFPKEAIASFLLCNVFISPPIFRWITVARTMQASEAPMPDATEMLFASCSGDLFISYSFAFIVFSIAPLFINSEIWGSALSLSLLPIVFCALFFHFFILPLTLSKKGKCVGGSKPGKHISSLNGQL
ncbi:hypothetical protein DCC81_25205 [Chitinophaga parva]|uniref:AcrB/AcrD/AcrF family protein n=1 Tax=Chitinophaga parva TaxID=2169414 RepID=A0A2T7BB92_9BACT|nr:efflux RND transporter permease subunit [Chitinophaga parva]PUZ21308.1 hypothetical protein DCC81_25205 [Chitinophaga parva]